eukprot:1854139-Ditylum_brightwellii.AAC.1
MTDDDAFMIALEEGAIESTSFLDSNVEQRACFDVEIEDANVHPTYTEQYNNTEVRETEDRETEDRETEDRETEDREYVSSRTSEGCHQRLTSMQPHLLTSRVPDTTGASFESSSSAQCNVQQAWNLTENEEMLIKSQDGYDYGHYATEPPNKLNAGSSTLPVIKEDNSSLPAE